MILFFSGILRLTGTYSYTSCDPITQFIKLFQEPIACQYNSPFLLVCLSAIQTKIYFQPGLSILTFLSYWFYVRESVVKNVCWTFNGNICIYDTVVMWNQG